MNKTPDHTNDGGHLSDEGVALFVDALKLGTVDQLPGSMRTHVAECEQCQRNVTGLFALLRKEDYSGVDEHPYFNLGRTPRRSAPWIWRAAAVIAALVLLPVLVYYLFVRTWGENPQQAGLNTAPAAGDTSASAPPAAVQRPSTGPAALAANLAPNPELDQLVAAGMRSTSLENVVPKNGAVVMGTAIRFDWNPHGQRQLTLIIMNNGGRELYSASITALPHIAGKRLEPGLYYWKVIDEQEAVSFGKFIVQETAQFPRSTKPAQK